MLRNITLSAEEDLISRARERARRQHGSLNEAFRRWLAHYAAGAQPSDTYDELMRRLAHVRSGRAFSREEMNER